MSVFGISKDPENLSQFTTAQTVVNATFIPLADNVFSYKDDVVKDVLDSSIKDWNHSAFYQEFQIRQGAGLAVAGYNSPVSNLIAPAYALPYLRDASTYTAVYHTPALNYDDETGSLVTDYATALDFALQLGYNVVTPLSPEDIEVVTLLAVALASLTKTSTLNLYDGVTYLSTIQKFSQKKLANKFAELKEGSVAEVLEQFSSIFGVAAFEYYGDANAETVFVVHGSVEAQLFAQLKANNVGVIAVRVALPFQVDQFVSLIPQSAKKLVVVGQNNVLKSQVAAALLAKGTTNYSLEEHMYEPTFNWNLTAVEDLAAQFSGSVSTERKPSYKFLLADDSPLVDVPAKLTVSLESSLRTTYDALTRSVELQIGAGEKSDVVVVEASRLPLYSLEKFVSFKGTLVVIGKPSKVPDFSNIVVFDPETVGDLPETQGRTLTIAVQALFWKYALGFDINEAVRRVWQSSTDIELLAAVLSTTINQVFESVTVPETTQSENNEDDEVPPPNVTQTSFFATAEPVETPINVPVETKLIFKESYGASNELRPDLPVKNFVVKVQENRRLTPSDYSRNIFHIEFDITGTGLTYNIGEALGVHARNNEQEVKEFLAAYGLKENDLVNVPVGDSVETRTILQTFTENLDILGKPPKRFYESLLEFANDDDKAKIQNVIDVELKNYQDVEYYTYVDILAKFPSAKPSVHDLINIVAPLKRREYSIASSQKMHPNAVHLLIVVVDWVDNQGRTRYGHASKYLSDLKIGSELVVSVKPSVMILPSSPKQPVIMSGLGTGLAPFKAFVEEKLWQKNQGMEIGDVFLYLGSRHKREEYLYGELWEAYKDAGIITHIGAAFSRDQPNKVYIQDKLRESLPQLKKAMIEEEGSFYLCGPTWPVPDITQVLKDIIAEHNPSADLNEEIEELKETSRYILEVY